MVQRLGSKHEAVEHCARWRWALAGAALLFTGAAACATGVDVSQAELAEICADSNDHCDDSAAGGGGTSGTGAVGIGGSSASGTSGNSGSSGSPSSTGGTSSGTSGSSGNSGSTGSGGSTGSVSNPPLQPLAKGMCMATSSVVIIYTDRSMGSTTGNQATMVLHVNNTGPTFNLTALTIRYWFTDEGLGDFTADIDYASQGGGMGNKGDVSVTFGKESGSNYASIGFSAGGSVGPEGVDTIQVRLHTNDYKMLDQSNDFSYLGSASAVANANITPYVNGTQVGGCVPLPQ